MRGEHKLACAHRERMFSREHPARALPRRATGEDGHRSASVQKVGSGELGILPSIRLCLRLQASRSSISSALAPAMETQDGMKAWIDFAQGDMLHLLGYAASGESGWGCVGNATDRLGHFPLDCVNISAVSLKDFDTIEEGTRDWLCWFSV